MELDLRADIKQHQLPETSRGVPNSGMQSDHCSLYVSLVSVSRKILPQLFLQHLEIQLQKLPASQ